MKIETLGIFDSGLGGYSVYHDLITQGPNIEYILYADQKHAPYGNKSSQEIYSFAKNAMGWFKDQGVDHVLLACNTVSAVALDQLKIDFPTMTIWGIIELTLSQIKDDEASIAVVSTQATFQSHAYQKAWENTENIHEYSLPKLVGMIEGSAKSKEIDYYLCQEMKKIHGQDYLILACTHFPLVESLFAKYFGGKILDSKKPIRDLVKEIAGSNNRTSKIYTSANSNTLKKQIKKLFNADEDVRRL